MVKSEVKKIDFGCFMSGSYELISIHKSMVIIKTGRNGISWTSSTYFFNASNVSPENYLCCRLIVKDLSIKHKFSALKIKCTSLFE